MSEEILLLGAFVAPVVAVGALLLRRESWLSRRASAVARRVARARAELIARLGSVGAAAAMLVTGAGAILAVCVPLGELAQSLQRPVDDPAYEWMRSRFDPDSPWTQLNAVVTMMGDPLPMLYTTIGAAVVLTGLWLRRRWWLPPLVLSITLAFEWYMQQFLSRVVDRGHPPTGLGTFPSGGSARVVAVYGVILFLVLARWPGISRRWRVVGWTAVGVLAAIEGYTRLYLLKHWFTDVPSGWIFGTLLLLVILAAASALFGRWAEGQLESGR